MAHTPRKPPTAGAAAQRPEMFIVPPITSDLVFGVLRREFSGVTNSATEFVHKKLHPFQPKRLADDPPGRIWRPTAVRSEILLPASVNDLMTKPDLLLTEFEGQAVAARDLVIMVKLIFYDDMPLHVSWERARLFGRVVLADRFGLATILAMHAPFLSAMRDPTPVHVHCLALARQLTVVGFKAFSELARDAGQADLVAAWRGL